MAYVAQIEQMDDKEQKAFKRALVRDPSAPKLSTGTSALMGMLGAAGNDGQIPRAR